MELLTKEESACQDHDQSPRLVIADHGQIATHISVIDNNDWLFCSSSRTNKLLGVQINERSATTLWAEIARQIKWVYSGINRLP